MTEPPLLLIRTEASAAMGMGHFMRCLAIAEAGVRAGMKVRFGLNAPEAFMGERVTQAAADMVVLDTPIGTRADADALIAATPAGGAIVVDTYRLNAAYLARLRAARPLVLIDDEARLPTIPVDVILNPSPAAIDLGYSVRAPEALCLLGQDHALVRREFLEAVWTPEAGQISVMMGGSDPRGFSRPVCEALSHCLPEARIDLIIGPGVADADGLSRWAETQARVIPHRDPAKVADLFVRADWVVTAAGGTLNELAAMGVRSLGLVVVGNQRFALSNCPYGLYDARRDKAFGGTAFRDWLKSKLGDPKEGLRRAEAAHHWVDGRGAERLISAIQTLILRRSALSL